MIVADSAEAESIDNTDVPDCLLQRKRAADLLQGIHGYVFKEAEYLNDQAEVSIWLKNIKIIYGRLIKAGRGHQYRGGFIFARRCEWLSGDKA